MRYLQNNLSVCAVALFFACPILSMEEDTMLDSGKRVAVEEPDARNVRRHVELDEQLVKHIGTLLEQNKFQEYFELIDSLDEDARKKAYDLEFITDNDACHKVMHWAACHNDSETIRELYKRGLSVNMTNRINCTAFHSAGPRGQY